MKEMRKCSFCGRTENDVEFMIPSPNGSANICDFCIDLCQQAQHHNACQNARHDGCKFLTVHRGSSHSFFLFECIITANQSQFE